MKVNVKHIVLIATCLLLILGSCHSGLRNFNKQKFTELKSIHKFEDENLVVEVSKEGSDLYVQSQIQIGIQPVFNTEVDLDDIVKVTDTSLIESNITRAILKGELIVINIRGRKLVLTEPSFRNGVLTGKLKPTSLYDLDKGQVTEVLVEGYEINEDGLVQIDNSLIKEERVLGQDKKGGVNEFEDRLTYEESLRSGKFQDARSEFRKALRWLAIGFACLGIMGLAVIVLSSVGLLALFMICGIALIVIIAFGINALLNAAIAMRKFVLHERKNKRKLQNQVQGMRVLIILGMLLFGSVPFLIPFIFMLRYVRKRARA